MELVTSFFGGIGLGKKPGKFLKSQWVSTLFYAVILVVGIHTLAIHRIPQYMAIYMLSLFVVAVIVGYVWEKRTFCTYVCPVGHLLGLYSLLSFSKLRVKDTDVCKSCKTKDCISSKSHYNFSARSCTSELFPPQITDNKNCILCGQCFKSCTKDNIEIKKRRFAEDLFSNISLKWAEIAFFIIISGFVVYEILSEWNVSKEIVMAIPHWLNDGLGITNNFAGTIKALALFIVLPTLFYGTLALLKKLIAGESWKRAFTQLIMIILPITASMHLLKALLKTTSRIPYWKFVASDPVGVDTATEIMQKPELLQSTFLTKVISPGISMFAILLPTMGLLLSFYVIKKQTHTNKTSRLISILAVLVYAGIFIITIVGWKLL